jgi:hypothetical protein
MQNDSIQIEFEQVFEDIPGYQQTRIPKFFVKNQRYRSDP